jgi:mRNA-degrading endonuclease RelE of RelBE toxin-antitoxin system
VTAARDLASLDLSVARRVVRKLEQAASDPERFFGRLVASEDSKRRVGDYRLLALVDGSTRTILIERLDHRSRMYR